MNTKKSLTESIEEVKNMKGSKATKKACLIKLGLRDYETTLLLDMWAHEGKENRSASKFVYTFGVEIECGVPYRNVRSASLRFVDHSGRYEHNNERSAFIFKYDGSVHAPNATELVSPILRSTNGLAKMKECCRALNEANAVVDSSCGLHVHIGAQDINEEAWVNTFVNFAYCEKVVDTFMAKSRRGNNNTYCMSILGKGVENCRTKDEVRRALRNNRYHKVNPVAENTGHRTIEFRQHQGTTNYEKIENWVKFCGMLVDWSRTNRLDHEITSIDEIPFITPKMKSFFKGRKSEFDARYGVTL